MTAPALRAPFPWFGGKSRAAHLVWAAFGDPPNYVEPFAGSLAVLLGRPSEPRVETVNDKDAFLSNFWRAVQAAPDEVVRWCDWPVSEVDLTARHQWLVDRADFRARMAADPDHFDAKIAGWWVWGLCSWIGTGWCDAAKYRGDAPEPEDPHLADPGRGVNRQIPHLGNPGRGVNRKIPHLGDPGRGVNRQIPHLADPGRGVKPGGGFGEGIAAASVQEWFGLLQDRLRRVRICCGDWTRVLTDSVLRPSGVGGATGILLDPPYADGDADYAVGGTGTDLPRQVAEWARANGDRRDLRIALCGFAGDADLPGWNVVRWKAKGGYSGGKRQHDERIWFSPACNPVVPAQSSLFGSAP